MNHGFYVVRMPKNGTGSRLIVESVPFKDKQGAENWRDFIQSQHPKDNVFVIEKSDEPDPLAGLPGMGDYTYEEFSRDSDRW